MKTITLVTKQWRSHGGIEQVNFDLSRALIDLGWRVEVVTLGNVEKNFRQKRKEFSVKKIAPDSRLIRSLWFRYLKWFLSPILMRLCTARSDLVILTHVSLIEDAKLLPNEKTVWLWAHGLEVWGDNSSILKSKQHLIDRVICVSKYTKSHVVKHYPKRSVAVIPNCVDIDKFTSGDNNVERDVILIAGRIAKGRRKGHDVLLENLALISETCNRQIRIRVVGTGDDEERLKLKAQKLGIDEQVSFLGRVDNSSLIKYYQSCNVFCLPAEVGIDESGNWYGEGFGIVYLEAAACCRPVICSSQGGAPETIQHGVTGYMVNPLKSEDVVNQICQLLMSDELSDKFGKSGRELVVSKFSFSSFKRSIADELEKNGMVCD